MTTLREAAQMALDALEQWEDEAPYSWSEADREAVEALRTALAKPEQAPTNNGRYLTGYKAQPEPEPVAWMYNGNIHLFDPIDWADGTVTPLYNSPPQREPCITDDMWKKLAELQQQVLQMTHREWQGLTTEDLANETDIASSPSKDIFDFRKAFWCGARWAEAKLREKNGA